MKQSLLSWKIGCEEEDFSATEKLQLCCAACLWINTKSYMEKIKQ